MNARPLETRLKEAFVIMFLDLGVERATRDLSGLVNPAIGDEVACDPESLAGDGWDKAGFLHDIDKRAGALMDRFGCAASALRSFMPIDMRGRTVQRLIQDNHLSNLARLLTP